MHISRHCGFTFEFGFLGSSESEIKSCALVQFGFGPDAAAMFLDNALDGCQAHARAFEVFRAVQALKHAEELVGILHAEAHAVVPHEHDRVPVFILLADLNDGLRPWARKLDRV